MKPRLIQIVLSYIKITEVWKQKPALCYKQCINLNPRMNIYMQLTLQIEMLTKTLFPVVCDSCNMSRYVYLFLNCKTRKKLSCALKVISGSKSEYLVPKSRIWFYIKYFLLLDKGVFIKNTATFLCVFFSSIR